MALVLGNKGDTEPFIRKSHPLRLGMGRMQLAALPPPGAPAPVNLTPKGRQPQIHSSMRTLVLEERERRRRG